MQFFWPRTTDLWDIKLGIKQFWLFLRLALCLFFNCSRWIKKFTVIVCGYDKDNIVTRFENEVSIVLYNCCFTVRIKTRECFAVEIDKIVLKPVIMQIHKILIRLHSIEVVLEHVFAIVLENSSERAIQQRSFRKYMHLWIVFFPAGPIESRHVLLQHNSDYFRDVPRVKNQTTWSYEDSNYCCFWQI